MTKSLITWEDLQKYVKQKRCFKGNLKTKDIKQFSNVVFAVIENNEIIVKKGKLIEMYRKLSGGTYHSFEIKVDDSPNNITISISNVIEVNPND